MHGMQQSIGAAVAGILPEFGYSLVGLTSGGAAGRFGFLVLTIERGCKGKSGASR
jgi:hypothetical protein